MNIGGCCKVTAFFISDYPKGSIVGFDDVGNYLELGSLLSP